MSDAIPTDKLVDDRSLGRVSADAFPGVVDDALGDHSFALCLTHDVDRPYKRHQALYYALRERSLSHLRDLRPGANPYWQFGEIADLERELGVRSAFYFLQSPHLLLDRPVREWVDPEAWVQFLGRYDVTDPEMADLVRDLADGGWEVGLHGSIPSHAERDRLRTEKATIEEVLGRPVLGGRQHYLRLDGDATWRRQADLGLRYDASLGSGTEYGFAYGDRPRRPFDDEFVVFPLTVMEQALPEARDGIRAAERELADLLDAADERGAVMTVLWHPRYFNDDEFPGHRRLYRRLVERALEMGAWVGPPARFYERMAEAAARQSIA